MYQLVGVPRPALGSPLSLTCFFTECLVSSPVLFQSSSRVLGQGKEKEINEALHLFAGKELRRAYGGAGNSELTSLGTRNVWLGVVPINVGASSSTVFYWMARLRNVQSRKATALSPSTHIEANLVHTCRARTSCTTLRALIIPPPLLLLPRFSACHRLPQWIKCWERSHQLCTWTDKHSWYSPLPIVYVPVRRRGWTAFLEWKSAAERRIESTRLLQVSAYVRQYTV